MEMLDAIAVPPDLLQAAIVKLRAKLDAKQTKFFTFQGEVIERVDVEDHASQLSAIDKIMAMAGVYVRERESVAAAPAVAVEVDPMTGVIRLVIGAGVRAVPHIEGDRNVAHNTGVPAQQAQPLALAAGADGDASPEAEPEVVKVRRGGLPTDVYKALFGNGE
jgi:hypothetical protein